MDAKEMLQIAQRWLEKAGHESATRGPYYAQLSMAWSTLALATMKAAEHAASTRKSAKRRKR